MVSWPGAARMGLPERQLMINHDKHRISIQPSASMQAGAIHYGPKPWLPRFWPLRNTTCQKTTPVSQPLKASHGPNCHPRAAIHRSARRRKHHPRAEPATQSP